MTSCPPDRRLYIFIGDLKYHLQNYPKLSILPRHRLPRAETHEQLRYRARQPLASRNCGSTRLTVSTVKAVRQNPPQQLLPNFSLWMIWHLVNELRPLRLSKIKCTIHSRPRRHFLPSRQSGARLLPSAVRRPQLPRAPTSIEKE